MGWDGMLGERTPAFDFIPRNNWICQKQIQHLEALVQQNWYKNCVTIFQEREKVSHPIWNTNNCTVNSKRSLFYKSVTSDSAFKWWYWVSHHLCFHSAISITVVDVRINISVVIVNHLSTFFAKWSMSYFSLMLFLCAKIFCICMYEN